MTPDETRSTCYYAVQDFSKSSPTTLRYHRRQGILSYTCVNPKAGARKTGTRASRTFVVGIAVSLAIACWDLRGFSNYEMLDMDSPRHALNGAFLFDCVRLGHITDAVPFAKQYFSHLPALSLPYHPPLFPLFEAAMYAGLGVSGSSARIAVGFFVAVSTFLLYSLIFATHGYRLQAVCAVVVFAFVPLSQYLGGEVMLEFPALALVLGSIYAFVRSGERLSPRLITISALLAGAGCWTKQTIFIGIVPFLALILERRFSAILTRRLVLWYGIFGLAVGAYGGMLLGLKWNGMGAFWAERSIWAQFLFNLRYYSLINPLTLTCILLTFATSVVLLAKPSLLRSDFIRQNSVYLALVIACVLVAVVVPAYDARYMFFAFPGLVAILLDATSRLLRLKFSATTTGYLLVAASMVFVVAEAHPQNYLRGPREAATLLVRAGARRILYTGVANGHFIFDVRTLDPTLQTVVIRGDKLPRSLFDSNHLDEFVQAYGVDYVVYQTSPSFGMPSISFPLVARIPVDSSERYLRGSLSIYRTGAANKNPKHQLSVGINSLGRRLDLEF